MHLALLLLALSIAWGLRLVSVDSTATSQKRWGRSLMVFLLSPLLLVMTSMAIVCMGPRGEMVRWWEGWFSYSLAVGFLVMAGFWLWKLSLAAGRSLRQVRSYPHHDLLGRSGRLLPVDVPFVAQIGFWKPELVVSQGVLDTFDADHLEAVLTHEQAHRHYHDTFWFFWLGWLRHLTFWLPQTEVLWQELLLLREQRADAWAAQQVDTLLLAESLLQMVSSPELYSEDFCAAFGHAQQNSRLHDRIDALLADPDPHYHIPIWQWMGFIIVFVPLLMVPFHY